MLPEERPPGNGEHGIRPDQDAPGSTRKAPWAGGLPE